MKLVAETIAAPGAPVFMRTMGVRGPTASVLKFAQQVIAEKGVRHGTFNPVPAAAEGLPKRRGEHAHIHPLS